MKIKVPEEFENEEIGKTTLSYFLDMEYNKGHISAMQLEKYYDEIKQLIRRTIKMVEIKSLSERKEEE